MTTHAQGIEAMNVYAASYLPYFDISDAHLRGLIAAYFVATNTIAVPRNVVSHGEWNAWDEFQTEANAKAGMEEFISMDMLEAGVAALVAEIDRMNNS